ncbi:bifunctional tRNA (5-methylaminomethyl-2-thiouridine)(34)-methyltransferase MnmD/FAD-dependent 5-carboxymethylaminomethyl-2-thiouridine(34) oxidoreductase MnmC [Glaciecola sp. MH2013]|uniref:bifunctional tRNA (5-methylaminomethyl-2-thiouridine)(34)-methyltransferase MnmD/FAD-dependent 5-carboxymethylaminomethyl-2-thiouridine(34) oxidoreductase MnmC n=1 Tax=Glaciecola sp. MH2013 TaxID=2785524 RepID=UPI00189EDFFA|nr:bifunctional tRNA (5-methylaminomethyl-2-thiouridine)(34)-methyltransferase MnmD/FAD-dependent 5-carboxymethylaminomethyl-2-thiouridine(34) oxidoreductase MnmC [Glaciecola sp. MH2013]MBF7072521.1 bifunctional tRNA (5-methylaminomethyl-2-thiouridine)(34)-methyltransferase MnmD/FAD-dependent 5-carboxymethylaminomethyl-2-thiouridine(34) oxidoreductase MnmC [Glaciecola sp. MH2013]
MKITSANIEFNEFGTPVAQSFDDVYFSNENGLKETQYVFIESNKLIERWQGSQSSSFSIGETGFGTGLNFLLTAKTFLDIVKDQSQQLYYLSTEKFPLRIEDLRKALNLWPELAEYSKELIQHYPVLLPGFHRISLFHGKVILDLFLGDATEGFQQCHSQPLGRIDAWFLDGFAPSKNNDMWNDKLYEAIARLSKADATFATFTAAGAVKRGLAAVGFDVKKQKGFGRKREMLVGENKSVEKLAVTRQSPIFHRHCSVDSVDAKKNHIAVVGGGIAAAIMALKLVERGKRVTLYCADKQLAQGASGNDQGGFYPQLNAEAGIASQIHAHSFLYARRFYDDILNQGAHFSHSWCGVLQLAFNDNVTKRYTKMMAKQTWPSDLVNWRNKVEASDIAGIDIPHDSLFLPLGGWISPPELTKACISLTHSLCSNFSVKFEHELINLTAKSASSLHQPQKSLALLHFECGNKKPEQIEVDAVVLACGSKSATIAALDLPFRLTRGQVESIPSSINNSKMGQLKTVLCHKGYMTPVMSGHLAMGSTYIKNDTSIDYRPSEAQINLAMHQSALQQATWANDIALNQGENPGRAAIRCSLPDHLPAVGAVPDTALQKMELNELYKAKPPQYYPVPSVLNGVYMLTGLGSRGLTTAPLAAELLASQICGEALPLGNPLLDALNPNRFLIKSLIRRQ